MFARPGIESSALFLSYLTSCSLCVCVAKMTTTQPLPNEFLTHMYAPKIPLTVGRAFALSIPSRILPAGLSNSFEMAVVVDYESCCCCQEYLVVTEWVCFEFCFRLSFSTISARFVCRFDAKQTKNTTNHSQPHSNPTTPFTFSIFRCFFLFNSYYTFSGTWQKDSSQSFLIIFKADTRNGLMSVSSLINNQN